MEAPGPTKTTLQADTLRLQLAQVEAEADRLRHAGLDLRKLDDARRRPSHAWSEAAERLLAEWERTTEAAEKRAAVTWQTFGVVAATIRQSESILDLADQAGVLKGAAGGSAKDLLVLRVVATDETGAPTASIARAGFAESGTFELHASMRAAKARQPGLRVERIFAHRSKGLLVVRPAVQAFTAENTPPPPDPLLRQLEEGEPVFLTAKTGRGHLLRRLTALRRLREHWSAAHLPLLQLFHPEHRSWGEAQPLNLGDLDEDWRLLRATESAARGFVRKAIGSADFCLLESAPGATRQRATLELILQALGRGRRLLVVGASAGELDALLAAAAATPGWADLAAPIRLTDEHEPTAESAREWDLDRQARRLADATAPLSRGRRPREVATELLLGTANVVLAPLTALGAHPAFRPGALGEDPQGFDLLIVLGAEQVTLADFLVPAVHARRWVLIGDPDSSAPTADPAELAERVATEALRARLFDELQAELAYKACVGKDGSADDEDADIPDAHGRRKVLLVLEPSGDEARSLATAQAYLRQRQLQTATIATTAVATFDPATLAADATILLCSRVALEQTDLAQRVPPEFRLIVTSAEPELFEPLARRVKLPKSRAKAGAPARAKTRPLIFLDWSARCAGHLQGLYDFRRPDQADERSRHIRALLLDLKTIHPFEKPLWEPQRLLRLKEQELTSILALLRHGVRETNDPERTESAYHAGLPPPYGINSRAERLPAD
ncbi:MAG: hypothetical protein RL250_365 [Verrucomicrobiota bacterium]